MTTPDKARIERFTTPSGEVYLAVIDPYYPDHAARPVGDVVESDEDFDIVTCSGCGAYGAASQFLREHVGCPSEGIYT